MVLGGLSSSTLQWECWPAFTRLRPHIHLSKRITETSHQTGALLSQSPTLKGVPQFLSASSLLVSIYPVPFPAPGLHLPEHREAPGTLPGLGSALPAAARAQCTQEARRGCVWVTPALRF